MMPSAPTARPPGPRGLPLLGTIAEFGRDKLGFFARCQRDHGDIVATNFAGWPTLLVSDMPAIERILVTEQHRFVKNSLVWRQTRALFGAGLLTSEGALWRRQRSLAAPSFAPRRLAGYIPSVSAITERTVDAWPAGEVFDMHARTMSLSLEVAAKTLFDSPVTDDVRVIDHALNDILRELEARIRRPVLLPDALPLPGHLRYRRGITAVEAVIERMIRARRDRSDAHGSDFLASLMAARDADGGEMSDQQLRDEAITLLLAGHETTALVLSWACYLLGQAPDVADRLADEVERIAPDRPLAADDLKQLRLTEATLLESMRLYPPSWTIGRESIEPFEIGGYYFPAGVTVFISQWVIHRDARYYEEPSAFRPNRWLAGLQHTLPRFAYMPFGGGPRVCIGQHFAMMEAVLMLATIIRRFRIEWVGDRPIVPEPSITLRPKHGVDVRLARRR
jgi:cytochrome P450